MDQICLILPVLPGRADYARDFMHELERVRLAEYDRSQQRIGIDREVWFCPPDHRTSRSSPTSRRRTSSTRSSSSRPPTMSSTCGSGAASPTSPASTSTIPR